MNNKRIIWVILVLTMALLVTAAALAQGNVGVAPQGADAVDDVDNLDPAVTEFGFISASVNGIGITETMGTINIDKPSGATVRSAYLATASTGFTGVILADGDITLEGTGVSWSTVISNSISSYNHWADVTTIVQPVVDAAPAGVVSLDYVETASADVDGSVLAVIFDDPNQTTINTIVLLFGAQNVAGDTFAIGLAEPIDLGDPDLLLDMGLGISFGCQGSNACGDPNSQISEVDVNGTRMTSSAGGQDDGGLANGALITVGGLGDSNANPPDPFSDPQGDTRYDDELYDLIPFVMDGDTSIDVFTFNPSSDDNIYFAYLVLNSTTAVVGEGIILGPLTATNCPTSDHTLTATVQDADGMPVEGTDVTFEVTSGPHMGTMGMDTTDMAGQASFTYTGTMTGTDTIIASFMDQAGMTIFSNEVTKVWDCTPTDVSLSGLGGEVSPLSTSVIAMFVAALLIIPAVVLVLRRSRIQGN